MSTQHSYNRINEAACNATETSKEFVEGHAMTTALTAFGLGVGAGVAIVLLLAENGAQRQDANVARRLGRQVLDAMAHAVPDSLTKMRR